MQQQLREAESRAEMATEQMASLLVRERQLLEERRELQRQLDKVRLEVARNARSGKTVLTLVTICEAILIPPSGSNWQPVVYQRPRDVALLEDWVPATPPTPPYLQVWTPQSGMQRYQT